MLTVVAPNVTTGAEIRPVAGAPPEQARSHTSRWSSVVPGSGAGKSGSIAHVAEPKPDGSPATGLSKSSAGTGKVGTGGQVAVGPERPAPHAARAMVEAR